MAAVALATPAGYGRSLSFEVESSGDSSEDNVDDIFGTAGAVDEMPTFFKRQTTPELTFEEHVKGAASRIIQGTWKRDEVNYWLKNYAGSVSVESHVADVMQSSVPSSFLQSRIKQLEQASLKQNQFLQERKNLKKKRFLVASDLIQEERVKAQEVEKAMLVKRGDARKETTDDAVPAKTDEIPATLKDRPEDGPQSERWSPVEKFQTYEEALRFVMKCQPFDFLPVGFEVVQPNRFDSISGDPYEKAISMIPVPGDFISTVGEFKRRLRVRHRHEDPEDAPSKKNSRNTLNRVFGAKALKGQSTANQPPPLDPSIAAEYAIEPSPPKPYHVEAAGGLFQHPASLRNLKENVVRYYIAVNPDIEKKVLAEGFKVKKRTSIPCSATPQEAISHFKNGELRCGRKASAYPSVLPVNVPPTIDVVAHKSGGFLIRATELPPSYFKATSSRRT